jgi:acetyl-CoA acyltransferase 1|mmetsp:Transcript_22605/g.35276  ORF Transcript_22605/g.35276 Transcript_22605/m.35276 type:complete len:422 (-) Transcript_22605:151-1416(-)
MALRLQKIVGHVQAGFLTPQATAGTPVLGAIGKKSPDDVVVVSALRTPICRAKKGGFKDIYPDDLLKAALEGVMKESGIKHELVDDVVVGNVQLDGAYAAPARMAQFRAGFPASVSLHTLNRQCSSGLQAVADVANAIKSGMIDIGIGAGVESMTHGGAVGGGSMPPVNLNALMENPLAKDCLIPMGMTAENVASRWGISREKQDQMGVESHAKALAAQAAGHFKAEIVPVPVEVDGKTVIIDADDGPRKTTLEGLAQLKTVFKKDGTVTAGTASQVSDGAAAVLLMRRSKADELGVKPIGVYRGARVCGVDPDVMGIGPAEAIPLALETAGLKMEDVDIFEINEAFAAQAVFCVEKLGVPAAKLNPKGGAIALGHPLGATGARQVATLLHELKRTGKKTGVVSMCIGTGMGMAAVFEAEN